MKVLVVDDEQIMLDSICLILGKEPDLQLEIAHTGREAIEKADLFHPELVMMDMKMPGINGLEALTEIRRMDPSAILVILTAYENFSYAQEGIRLNVYDYLVKPIHKTRLLELVDRARQQLAKIRKERLEELVLRERYKKLLPIIENEFISELINGITEDALTQYQELLALQFTGGFFLAVSYRHKINTTMDALVELSFVLRQKINDIAEEIRHLIPCLVAPVKLNPLTIFIPLGPNLPATSLEAISLSRKIIGFIQKEPTITDIHIGIGRTYPASSELKRSYQESLLALSYCGGSPIFHYDDVQKQQGQDWEHDFDQKIQEILDSIRYGNAEKVETLTTQLFSKYTHFQENQDRLFFYLLELLVNAYRIGRDSKAGNTSLPGFEQIIALFKGKQTLHEIIKEITQRLISLALLVREGRTNQVKTIIRQAKEIIDRQFTQTVNLDEISHTIGISPFYFSRLFREEMGVSFSEYVTKLRMDKALSLLAQGISVKECCFSIGYNDPNYFSRIFRKYYEMTPTEYRDEQIQMKGER